jgi:phage terminase small subunit
MNAPARLVQLTASEEKFCREFVATQNGMVAYAKAFPQYKDPRTQRLGAADLMQEPRISQRIQELQESLAETYNFTFEEHLHELKRIRDEAANAKQFRAALDAEVTRGKLVGFYDRVLEKGKSTEQHLHLHEGESKEVTDDARTSAIIQMFKRQIAIGKSSD